MPDSTRKDGATPPPAHSLTSSWLRSLTNHDRPNHAASDSSNSRLRFLRNSMDAHLGCTPLLVDGITPTEAVSEADRMREWVIWRRALPPRTA